MGKRARRKGIEPEQPPAEAAAPEGEAPAEATAA